MNTNTATSDTVALAAFSFLQAFLTVTGAWRSSWHPCQHAQPRVSGPPTDLHYPSRSHWL